jgi:hypothetical protein
VENEQQPAQVSAPKEGITKIVVSDSAHTHQAKHKFREIIVICAEFFGIHKAVRWLVKEGRGVKDGWVLFSIIAILLLGGLYYGVTNWEYGPQISNLENINLTLNQSVSSLTEDRDAKALAFQSDENVLLQLRTEAKNQFPNAPSEKGVQLLLQKFDQLQQLLKDTPTKEMVQSLADQAEIQKNYHDVANMNFFGVPQIDNIGLPNENPISKLLEDTVTPNSGSIAFKGDAAAEQKFRDVIALEPKFPFSYVALGVILQRRGDSGWRDCFIKAESILEKTTSIPGHSSDHDACLKIVKDSLSAPPDNIFSQPDLNLNLGNP